MKSNFIGVVLFFLCCVITVSVVGQPVVRNLQDSSVWGLINRKAEWINENGKKGIRFSEAPDNGLLILKGVDFTNGVIELDIKGSNKFQQSFVGFAFHGGSRAAYDAIYFRPFNFKSDDAVRRSHAVQYISMPGYDWEKLRTDFPGKYENKIEAAPGPDDWFHVKILVNGKRVSVFVNNESKASLEVDKLNSNNKGWVGFWAGNNSGGDFANLTITADATAGNEPAPPTVAYGNNAAAGHYFNAGDTKLYYEIYGHGKPLVLLHGGLYGYIDEFQPFIEKLTADYQVICIGTRAHGKSEIGRTPFKMRQSNP